ncbi:MAG: DEAD/DEAH box helicase [bacterium]
MLDTIRLAISWEAEHASKPMDWHIEGREAVGKLWKVNVDPGGGQLDESLEGATAWWPGPPKGVADVLSVVPENLQINLRYATAQVPQSGLIRIYPIRFLDKLSELWESPLQGPRYLDALESLQSPAALPAFPGTSPHRSPELRIGQKSAFELLRYRNAFLWGPPGTGKTHALGCMIAAFLMENPGSRVLLLSTTNTAVDLAITKVDDALERMTPKEAVAGKVRLQCKRIGSHINAEHYQNKSHLLPKSDPVLVQRLAALQASRPDPADVAAYSEWKEKVAAAENQIRAQAKTILAAARVAALTCTRGVFSYGELVEFAPYDLVVFDEASQVGLAHAAPFLLLGRRVLFAGDPKQLEPIVCADDPDVKKWLGRSPFDLMKEGQANVRMLDEQSRMAEDICHVVSHAFYGGKLRVCAKAASNPNWIAERKLINLPTLHYDRTHCLAVATEGHLFQHSAVRPSSVNQIIDLVEWALLESDDLIILTPYRMQRAAFRSELKKRGITGVQVSTVHRAQGREKRIVFFDPVLGTHKALTDRLINVALSRAKSRLVVALSQGDLANPRLAQIRKLLALDISDADAVELLAILTEQDFPKAYIGQKVKHKACLYTLEGVEDGGMKVVLCDCVSGALKKFKRDTLLQLAAATPGATQ